MGHSKKLKYDITESGCFICTSHTAKRKFKGYESSKIWKNGKAVLMHRWIYEEMFGVIPEGQVVRHKCDNGLCINPEHMELGTFKENSEDMVERGRSCKGSKHGRAILDEEKVRVIKRKIAEGEQLRTVAKLFNVHPTTITKIKNNTNWGHVI